MPSNKRTEINFKQFYYYGKQKSQYKGALYNLFEKDKFDELSMYQTIIFLSNLENGTLKKNELVITV